MSNLASRVQALEAAVAALEAAIGSGADPRPRTVAPEDQDLADRLRQWRRERAAVEDVKPFHVFGDRVLAAIVTIKPADRFELAQIKGFGEQRIKRYGNDVLGVISGDSW